ncbi:rRNA-processing protein UTP23 homolog [Betta splendens]|uniref:rRNA-processing protein UTP23 homolog n=1 Tax=Betta splendens TaxID=158456 RepID=A0A6P7NZN9_BETSP|nr:rRNA-processing protein UTP23 homolog [Betta splendens]
MKIKRQKLAKKTISFYKYNFSFREPFQILVDGTFCQAALKNKIQIKEQIPKYLMGEIQLCTTSCVLKELESLGGQLYGAKVILQRFQVRKCPHFKKPVCASECLLSMLEETNPHHYFVATQDPSVTAGLKKVPGVPLLYIVLNTIVLDKPSQVSLDHVQAIQLGNLISPSQQQSIHSLKDEQGISRSDGESQGKKRKRKQHHPNPLSCLKKKKKPQKTPLKKTEPGEKRKRSRHKRRKKMGGDVSAPAVTNP